MSELKTFRLKLDINNHIDGDVYRSINRNTESDENGKSNYRSVNEYLKACIQSHDRNQRLETLLQEFKDELLNNTNTVSAEERESDSLFD